MFKITNGPIKSKEGFLDSLFDDIFETPILKGRGSAFKLDIKEEEKEFIVEAELPGVKKEEIKISYEDQNLIISIEREEKLEEEKDNYLHRERSYSSAKRAIRMPNIDPGKIKAKLEEGLLKLNVEKQEPAPKGHIIEIE